MEKLIKFILIFSFFLFLGCAQNNQKKLQTNNPINIQTNNNETTETTLDEQNNQETIPPTREIVVEEEKATKPKTSSKTIREHYYDGNFRYIINQTFTKNQLQDFYYKGFAYYGLARGIKNNPPLKKRYIEESKKILKRVGVYAKNKELKARAILWYGLLKNVFPNKKLNNYEKISPFEYIKTRLKNTKSYDDALFYSGLVYENVGYYKSAKINYSMLDKIADNNFIYHYARRKVYPAKTISTYYLKNIDRKLADLRKQKSQPKTQNPVTPQEETSNEVGAINNELLGLEADQDFNLQSTDIKNQEVFYEVDQDPAFFENDSLPISNLKDDALEDESIYYEEDNEVVIAEKDLEKDLMELGEELDVSLDGFLKNLSKKKEKNNQEIFILDDN